MPVPAEAEHQKQALVQGLIWAKQSVDCGVGNVLDLLGSGTNKVVDIRGKCMLARRWNLDDLPKFLRDGDALRSPIQEVVVIILICA